MARITGSSITPAMQLIAIAAARRVGYEFDASELHAIDGAVYEFIDDHYTYWISEDGTTESTAPWQLRVG